MNETKEIYELLPSEPCMREPCTGTQLKERNGLTDDLKNKIDIFFATGRITEEQYNELMDINKEEEPKAETN